MSEFKYEIGDRVISLTRKMVGEVARREVRSGRNWYEYRVPLMGEFYEYEETLRKEKEFLVGDRVVAVDLGEENGNRGTVTGVGVALDWPIAVHFDHGSSGLCREDELEFEEIYDELSKSKDQESILSASEVDRRSDVVNHPSHYTSHPSGIECIEITKHHNFCIGSAIKYLWRAGLKGEDTKVQDLQKAIKFIEFEIERLGGAA